MPYFLCWIGFLTKLDQPGAMWLQGEGLALFAAVFEYQGAMDRFLAHPPAMSLFLIVNLIGMPLFVLLAGCDQFSSDLGGGFFRLCNSRASRLEMFIGRYLSSFALISLALIGMGVVITVACATQMEEPGIAMFYYFIEIEIKLLLYAAALLSFMSMISALTRSAIGSIFLGGVTYCALLFMIFLAGHLIDGGAVLIYLLPSVLKPALINLDLVAVMPVLMLLIVYGVVYACLAWFIFSRRGL